MDLVQEANNLLHDTIHYLEKMSDSDYVELIPDVFNSSIGMHTRHFIEFYQCLIDQSDTGTLNYSLRQRDPGIESDPRHALEAISQIMAVLPTLELDQAIQLVSCQASSESVVSSVGRELQYNIEHTIHHLAIIRIGLKMICPDLHLPAHFGLAPSTVRHRQLVANN